jgi:hypothetical protein
MIDMTPKEMAKSLVNEFDGVGLQMRNEAIACALICVNRIAKEIQDNAFVFDVTVPISVYTYWKNVKEEIEKL